MITRRGEYEYVKIKMKVVKKFIEIKLQFNISFDKLILIIQLTLKV